MKTPKVKKAELLRAFERVCKLIGKKSNGFDANINLDNGRNQWAMLYRKKCGWMVVCGSGGCGAALSRWNGYLPTRWSFLMMLEAVETCAQDLKYEASKTENVV